MYLRRIFHPVGHGAFFVERFYLDEDNVLNVVYDCGDNKTGHADKAISNEFGKASNGRQEVDVLFISHFDNDHVSALPTLAKYMKPSTKVFMPFFYPDYAKVLYSASRWVNVELVLSVLRGFGIRPVLVRYSENIEGGTYDIDDDNYAYHDEVPGIPFPVIQSGSLIRKTISKDCIWKYVPFNLFNENKLFADFAKELTKLQWPEVKIKNPATWTNDDIKKIREKYHLLQHSINDNSLLVLSMSCVREWSHYNNFHADLINKELCRQGCCHYFLRRFPNSCLYTGDTVLKRGARGNYTMTYEDLLVRVGKHTKKIGLVQIPHHGSGNNVNMATLVDSVSCSMFANYGNNDEKNKVFFLKDKDLESVWKPLFKVTETSPITVFEMSV